MRILFLILLFAVGTLKGATNTAATLSLSDVRTAYWACAPAGALSTPDTLKLPFGTNTWSDHLVLTNPVIIVGNGTNQTGGATMIINSQSSGSPFQGVNDLFRVDLAVQGRLEISGIKMQDSGLNKDSTAIRIDNGGNVFERILIIHNNLFEGFYFSIMNNGAWGLCYSNHHLNNDWTLRCAGFDTLSSLPVSNPESYKWSSTNYWVLEDELFQYSSQGNDRYFIDTDSPANYMIRYSTFSVNRTASVGAYIYDQHGESGGGDAHVPLGPVFYKNTCNYSGDGTQNSGNKIGDVRGGANALCYSNTVTTVTMYVAYRDDYTPNVANKLLTNCYQWANNDAGGSMGVEFDSDGQDGVTVGVHFFTNGPPSNFSQLAYPHPLRAVAAVAPTKRAATQGNMKVRGRTRILTQ